MCTSLLTTVEYNAAQNSSDILLSCRTDSHQSLHRFCSLLMGGEEASDVLLERILIAMDANSRSSLWDDSCLGISNLTASYRMGVRLDDRVNIPAT